MFFLIFFDFCDFDFLNAFFGLPGPSWIDPDPFSMFSMTLDPFRQLFKNFQQTHGPMSPSPWARPMGPGPWARPMGLGPWARAHGPGPWARAHGPNFWTPLSEQIPRRNVFHFRPCPLMFIISLLLLVTTTPFWFLLFRERFSGSSPRPPPRKKYLFEGVSVLNHICHRRV